MRDTVKWLLRLVLLTILVPNLLLWLPWCQDFLRQQIAKRSDIQVESISGCFPFYVCASGVRYQQAERSIQAKEASFWMSPGMLMAGWLQIEDFAAEGVTVQSPELTREIPLLRLSGDGAWSWATGGWRADLSLYQADRGNWSRLKASGRPRHPIRCSIEEPAGGLLTSYLEVSHPAASQLTLDLRPDASYSRLKAFYRWESTALNLQSCGELHWQRGGNLEVQSVHAQGPEFTIDGQGSLSPDMQLEDCTLTLHLQQLPEIPGISCCGGADITVNASGPLLEPQLEVQLFSDFIDLGQHELTAVRCAASLSSHEARVNCTTLLREHTLVSKLKLMRDGKKFDISSLSVSYDGYQLDVSGGFDLSSLAYWFDSSLNCETTPRWSVHMAGHGSAGEQPQVQLSKLDGRLETLPISGDRLPTVRWDQHGLALSPFRVRVGNGALSGELRADDAGSELIVDLAALPADLIAIFQPQVSLDGLLTGEVALSDNGEGVYGSVNIAVSGLRFLESDFEDNAPVEGNMHFTLSPGRCELEGKLNGLDRQPSRLSAELPVSLGLRPLRIDYSATDPIMGYLEAHGHLAPFLQPLMVDSNRIRGQVSAQLALSGSWKDPELRGHINLIKGTYESLFTGTTFKGVQASIVADGPSLVLERFTAHSGKNGIISGEGALALDPKNDFPFTVDMQLRKTKVIQIDHLNAQVAGNLRLEGTLNQATLSGNVKLTEAHIHIPDKLPKDIPTLDVIYVNNADPNGVSPKQHRPRIDPYPLYLDVYIDAPRNLFLNGRGLTTEWGGEVAVKGSTAQPMLFGTANLLRGDFLIAGTVSPLTHGVIHMDGLASRDVQLSLSCDLEVGDVSLPLTLAGPLHALEIEGLSDLSRVDALLLAQAALRLTGGQVAPDILENLRRRTGLDLLDFGTVGEDDDREFIVQVGKYFSKGVSISVARSMAEKGSRTAVDLSLTKNLKLRAEIAEGEEAANDSADVKLLLKWKYDY